MSAKILVFAGSTRNGSYNVKLASALANTLNEKGADVLRLDLADYDLPIFNSDIDVPAAAMSLAEAFSNAEGLVIVSPEYNASVTPLLKNALDWISVTRKPADGAFGPYRNKTCYLASCSPGATGGLRGLYHLRAILMNVGAEIITSQLAVGNAATAFDDEGRISNDRLLDMMNNGLDDLLLQIARIKAHQKG